MWVFGTEFMWIRKWKFYWIKGCDAWWIQKSEGKVEQKHVSVHWVVGMAKWDIVLCACVFLKFCVHRIVKKCVNALFQPMWPRKRWPTCLGQTVWQLKKWVDSIPITTLVVSMDIVTKNTFFDLLRSLKLRLPLNYFASVQFCRM